MTPEDTFLALLKEHRGALLRIARQYAGVSGEEDDLYQEILSQVWKSLPSFKGTASGGTWVYRVALNTALTWRRRVVRRERRVAHLPPNETAPPASRGEPRSQQAILEDFLSRLSGPDHSLLLLYMEGLSYKEIAEAMGLSENAVGVRLHRMKQAFNERYVER